MDKTKIEWCDSTFNPVTGCLHGCEYCYAKSIAERFGGYTYCGAFSAYVAHDKQLWDIETPFRFHDGRTAVYPFEFEPTMHRYRLDIPERWTRPRTIFVCSMADLFGDWVPDEWIEAVFAACEKAPQHRYLFLTKSPKRYGDLAKAGKLPKKENFWYGTTITGEHDAESIYDLRSCKEHEGVKTFVSVEPLIEPMWWNTRDRIAEMDWVIIGAETGKRSNKVVPAQEWVLSIAGNADVHNTPVFMKDSLVPVVGEVNMRREFPWKSEKRGLPTEENYSCANCPFSTRTMIWDGTNFEPTPFCSYHGNELVYHGNCCTRERTHLDDD